MLLSSVFHNFKGARRTSGPFDIEDAINATPASISSHIVKYTLRMRRTRNRHWLSQSGQPVARLFDFDEPSNATPPHHVSSIIALVGFHKSRTCDRHWFSQSGQPVARLFALEGPSNAIPSQSFRWAWRRRRLHPSQSVMACPPADFEGPRDATLPHPAVRK